MKIKTWSAVLCLLTAVACGSQLEPVEVANGNFETGDFTGWLTDVQGSGNWFVYEDGSTPPDPRRSDGRYPFDLPNPPEGNFAAVTDMRDIGRRILCQDLVLNGAYMLHFTVFYENLADRFQVMPTFDLLPADNQHFRVDLMDPSAEVDSL